MTETPQTKALRDAAADHNLVERAARIAYDAAYPEHPWDKLEPRQKASWRDHIQMTLHALASAVAERADDRG